MALALYFLPILLQVATSRVHHHRDVQDIQNKLAGVDLADVLIPILNKQEQEYKANNHSDKRVHALKKLIERSHVAIILAKPHDKGENHSIDSKYASSEEVSKNKHIKHLSHNVLGLKHANSREEEGNHKLINHQSSEKIENNAHSKDASSEEKEKYKHLEHPSFTKIEHNKLLKLAGSKESSEEDLVSSEKNTAKINNFRKSGLNTKHKDSNEDNSQEEVEHKAQHPHENYQHVFRKELKEEENNKKNVEYYLQDVLDSIHDSSESDEETSVEGNLLKSEFYSEHKDSHEKIKHKNENKQSLENREIKQIEKYIEKEEYDDTIKLFKDILNSRNRSSESDKEKVEDNNLHMNELNNKNETHENNSPEKVKHKDENQHSKVNRVLQKEDHKDKDDYKISVKHLKDILNFRDESSESNEEDSVGDNNLHSRSGLSKKLNRSHEYNSHKEVKHVERKYSLFNKNSHKEREDHKNCAKHLQEIFNSLGECSKCDDEDIIEDHDSLTKIIEIARPGNKFHFYNRHDNEKKHDGGVRNLFFYFA